MSQPSSVIKSESLLRQVLFQRFSVPPILVRSGLAGVVILIAGVIIWGLPRVNAVLRFYYDKNLLSATGRFVLDFRLGLQVLAAVTTVAFLWIIFREKGAAARWVLAGLFLVLIAEMAAILVSETGIPLSVLSSASS